MSLKKLEKTVFFLCLLLLPTQLGKHFWPQFAFIYSLPVDYLSPTIYLWDLLLIALIGLWFLNLKTDSERRINWRVFNLFLLYIFTILSSALFAKNMGASFAMLFRITTAGLFGIYIASQELNQIRRTILYGLALGVFYETAIAFLEFISAGSLNLWILGERAFSISTPGIATFNYLGQVFLRPYATFPHPNVLAAYMVIALPLIVRLAGYSVVETRLKIGSIVAGAITLFLTFSRSAIAVGLIEGFILLRRRLKLAVIPLIMILPLLWIRYNSIFNFDILSLTRREELDVIALIDFKQAPLFGVGLNNFINQTAQSSLISGPTRFLQPVHNILLLTMAETGLLGLVGFLALTLVPLSRLWRQLTLWNKSLLFIWGSIILLGMVDHYFLTLPQGQRLFFLVWGLSFLK